MPPRCFLSQSKKRAASTKKKVDEDFEDDFGALTHGCASACALSSHVFVCVAEDDSDEDFDEEEDDDEDFKPAKSKKTKK